MTGSHAPTTAVKTYLLVFLGLAILTGTTVLLSYLGLPHPVAISLAVLIAVVKCTLIGAFFMHLRFESKAIYWIFFTALFLVLFLAYWLFPDIAHSK